MKAPITLSKFGSYAFVSALCVLTYSMMGYLIETLHSPKTIKQALVLYVLQLSLTVLFHIYIERRKKSPEPHEGE